MRMAVAALCIGVVGLMGMPGFTGGSSARAAAAFADPAFGMQWAAGEALTPNFWGPLANARVGVIEPWNEAPNGRRVVQYFDKGRMELGAGSVTSGLLATELIFGRVQTGATSFDSRPPPTIPIAGDASNPGPTYAAFGGPAASLLTPTTAKMDNREAARATTALNADGTVATFMPGADYVLASFTDFDLATKHNVVRAFATYRDKLGLASIGYAVSEPFWCNLLVGGTRRAVLIQVFERRVLTYTPENPTEFAVEMGNIGAQYYRWRYESSPTDVPPVIAPTAVVAPIAVTTPTLATTPGTTRVPSTVPAMSTAVLPANPVAPSSSVPLSSPAPVTVTATTIPAATGPTLPATSGVAGGLGGSAPSATPPRGGEVMATRGVA